jgi:hypothetical protein
MFGLETVFRDREGADSTSHPKELRLWRDGRRFNRKELRLTTEEAVLNAKRLRSQSGQRWLLETKGFRPWSGRLLQLGSLGFTAWRGDSTLDVARIAFGRFG